ncbi:MAG: hypothetical protein ACI9V1_001261 [Spirosomataceae bacterium]
MGIEVRVTENGTNVIKLIEKFPGIYEMPIGFQGRIGNTYQLSFRTDNGNHYESIEEEMLTGPKIDSIYEVFNPTGIENSLGNPGSFPSNDIYANFQDPVNSANYYHWTWKIREPLTYCETCKQGKYYFYETDDGTTGDCFRDLTLNPSTIYDYTCGSFYW